MLTSNPDFFYYASIHHHSHHGRDALLIDDLNLQLRSILDYAYSANHLGGDGNHRRLPHRQTLIGVRFRPSPAGTEALRAPSAPTRSFSKTHNQKHINNNAITTHHISSYGNHRRLSHRQTLTGVRLRPSPAGAEALREPSAPTRLVFKKNQPDFSHAIHHASSQHHLHLARNLGEPFHNKPHQAHLPYPHTALSRADSQNFNLQQQHDHADTTHRLGRRRRGHNRRYAHRAQQKITSEPVVRGNAARVSRARRGLS